MSIIDGGTDHILSPPLPPSPPPPLSKYLKSKMTVSRGEHLMHFRKGSRSTPYSVVPSSVFKCDVEIKVIFLHLSYLNIILVIMISCVMSKISRKKIDT